MLAAFSLLALHKADLRVPFEYRGDALLYSSVIKSIVDHGWFWNNPNLSAPGGLQLYDYPNVAHESFHLLIIKSMAVFSGDWPLLLNLYFLLGFPLITVSAMAVFRRCGASLGSAMVGGVLYSFLPSRLLKGEGHVFLDVFYQVPLAVLVLLWVCSDTPPFWDEPGAASPGGGVRRWSRARLARAGAALAVCALGASTSSYYAFFTIGLLAFAGAWASIERRSWRNAIAAAVLVATIVAGMVANGLPSIIYHLRHGPNVEVGRRGAAESEVFGMKIAQLLLPTTGHRIAPLRQLKQRYDATAPLVGENSVTSLGVVGSVGFLVLLGALLIRRRDRAAAAPRPSGDLMRALATLNLGAVLLGTMGGFGSLVAYLVLPQIRTYSRLVVFIAFFALFAVVLLLDRLRQARPFAARLALPIVLGIGLFDQATPAAVRPYAREKEAFASDRSFVRRIEGLVPRGDVVFALPYAVFPEGRAVNRMISYDLLRPYLHSSTLRWSLPTMRGRGDDAFVRATAAREPAQMLEILAQVGYGGIFINRDGYADEAVALEAALRGALLAEPLVSDDRRLSFFDLAGYRRGAAATLPRDEVDRLLHPLTFTFGEPFFGVEHDADGPFRWCGHQGEIHIDNDARAPRRAEVRATFFAAQPPAVLTLDGDLISARLELSGATPFVRAVEIPPGHHVIRFRSEGRPAEAPGEARTLVWRIAGFALEEGPIAPPLGR